MYVIFYASILHYSMHIWACADVPFTQALPPRRRERAPVRAEALVARAPLAGYVYIYIYNVHVYVYVCIYIYIYTYTHVQYIYIYIHTCGGSCPPRRPPWSGESICWIRLIYV